MIWQRFKTAHASMALIPPPSHLSANVSIWQTPSSPLGDYVILEDPLISLLCQFDCWFGYQADRYFYYNIFTTNIVRLNLFLIDSLQNIIFIQLQYICFSVCCVMLLDYCLTYVLESGNFARLQSGHSELV